MFEKFLSACPAETDKKMPVDSVRITRYIEETLHVKVPDEIKLFWDNCGCRYFGGRVFYVFGDGSYPMPRDSLIDWNSRDFWPKIYPSPQEGGPVFFSETCSGDQIGFRWSGKDCVYILFCIDTFEAFTVAHGTVELFDRILADRYALLDEIRFDTISSKLGVLREGMHYAPIISPMLGGAGEIENFGFETPNVHFRTSIAAFEATREK